jgi:hypothetical protein
VKTRSPASVAQQSDGRSSALIRMIQLSYLQRRYIAHCRYGTTFSHTLGGQRSVCFQVVGRGMRTQLSRQRLFRLVAGLAARSRRGYWVALALSA